MRILADQILSQARSVQRVVASQDFANIERFLTSSERITVIKAIEESNSKTIKGIVKNVSLRHKKYDALTVHELRQMSKGIDGYYRMDKETLIGELCRRN